jgi:hypothetical protein
MKDAGRAIRNEPLIMAHKKNGGADAQEKVLEERQAFQIEIV